MNIRYILPALAVGALMAGGCAAVDTAPKEPVWAAPVAQVPTPPAPTNPVYGAQDRNERDNLPKALGQPAGLTNADDSILIDFAVTGIRESKCLSTLAQRPENGRYLVVDLVANTHADPDAALPLIQFSYGWEFIAADGTSIEASTVNAAMCSEDQAPDLKPNRKYTTTFLVDVPDAAGKLSWSTHFAPGGWEWDLPA